MSSCRVLKLYKQLLRLGQGWIAKDPDQTVIERNYITEQVKTLFRNNKNIRDETEISRRILEAEARLTMAEHYRNPYPRPVNLPPGSYSKKEGKRSGKSIERRNQISKPVYIRSIDD